MDTTKVTHTSEILHKYHNWLLYYYYSSLCSGANVTTNSPRGKTIGPVIQRDTVATHPACIDFPSQFTVQYPQWQQQEMTAYHANAMVMGASGDPTVGDYE